MWADYVPSYRKISDGRRANLPVYYPEVTFHRCQDLSPIQMTDLVTNLTTRLCNGPYDLFIAAIVVVTGGENCDTRFSIWLEDGRRLDSGFIFFDASKGFSELKAGFDDKLVGKRLYIKAMNLLHEALPSVEVTTYFR
jgi:hypothetical protein